MNYTTARNIIIYDELGKILPVFNSADIEVIVLAGAALGATVYPNISERPMGDIDLLIRHRDKQAIGKLLGTLGYALDTARSDEAHYSKTLDTFTLHIDCHTDLRHYLDDRALAGVWNRACPERSEFTLSVANVLHAPRSTLILSPEDTLIYTAVDSAIYHGRITANTINDITNIIRYYQNTLDWDLVVRLIKHYRLETPLYILFDLCRKEGVSIPDDVMSSLHPRKRSLEYYLYKTILYASRSTLYAMDDLSRVARFLTRPHARWELFTNSFFPSLRFVKQCYDIVDMNGDRGTGRSTLYALRSTLLYPARALSLFWRMNKAMYQLTMRVL